MAAQREGAKGEASGEGGGLRGAQRGALGAAGCGRALALLMITMRSTSPDSSSSRRKSAKVISCFGVRWALEIGPGLELGLRRWSLWESAEEVESVGER